MEFMGGNHALGVLGHTYVRELGLAYLGTRLVQHHLCGDQMGFLQYWESYDGTVVVGKST